MQRNDPITANPGRNDRPHLPVACRDTRGHTFTVRELRTSDRLALEAFYGDFEPNRVAQGLPPRGSERIARWLDAVLPRGIHLVVEMREVLVGHAMVVPTGEEGVGEYAIFLRSDLCGHGLGTAVNQVAIEAARAAGLRRLWLTVEPRHRAAVRSYQKSGFRFLPGTDLAPEAEMEISL